MKVCTIVASESFQPQNISSDDTAKKVWNKYIIFSPIKYKMFAVIQHTHTLNLSNLPLSYWHGLLSSLENEDSYLFISVLPSEQEHWTLELSKWSLFVFYTLRLSKRLPPADRKSSVTLFSRWHAMQTSSGMSGLYLSSYRHCSPCSFLSPYPLFILETTPDGNQCVLEQNQSSCKVHIRVKGQCYSNDDD